jgi:hypothetical protein
MVAVNIGNLMQASPESGAMAHGHIVVRGMRGAPSYPIQWMHVPGSVAVVLAKDDPEVDDELQGLLMRVVRAFFRDVSDLAPGVAHLHLSVKTMR